MYASFRSIEPRPVRLRFYQGWEQRIPEERTRYLIGRKPYFSRSQSGAIIEFEANDPVDTLETMVAILERIKERRAQR